MSFADIWTRRITVELNGSAQADNAELDGGYFSFKVPRDNCAILLK